MGLSATIVNAVNAAFTAVGDVKETITYISVVEGGYDHVTDTYADIETTTVIEVPMIAPTERELGWFPATDVATKKILIKAADLASEPTLRDRVTFEGTTYNVMRTKAVPGRSLFIVWIRGT